MAGEGIDIDLGGAVDPNAPVPEGEYDLEVYEIELTESKANDPMVAAQYQVFGHPEFSGKIIFDYMVLAGKGGRFGVWALKSLLEACGHPTQGVRPTDIDYDSLKGKKFRALVSVEPPSGGYGESNRVKKILS